MNQKGLVHTIGVAAILVLVLAVGIYVAVSTPGITGAQVTPVCGDGICDIRAGEDPNTCPADCVEVACADGIDNDLDGSIDCADSDCSRDPACSGRPICGNDIREPLTEHCDLTDDDLCPGQCTPPGQAGECLCPGLPPPGSTPPPTCGNGVLDPQSGETCDGNDDAACPGACLPPGDPAECQCGFIQPPPQHFCGNGQQEVGETCDPGKPPQFPFPDDAACPGQCGPAGFPGECTCPGGGGPGGVPVCGDGIIQQPEQCEKNNDAACPGRCTVACTCGLTPTFPEENDLIGGCNNGLDDDGDGRVDGADSDCDGFELDFCGDWRVNSPETCDPPGSICVTGGGPAGVQLGICGAIGTPEECQCLVPVAPPITCSPPERENSLFDECEGEVVVNDPEDVRQKHHLKVEGVVDFNLNGVKTLTGGGCNIFVKSGARLGNSIGSLDLDGYRVVEIDENGVILANNELSINAEEVKNKGDVLGDNLNIVANEVKNEGQIGGAGDVVISLASSYVQEKATSHLDGHNVCVAADKDVDFEGRGSAEDTYRLSANNEINLDKTIINANNFFAELLSNGDEVNLKDSTMNVVNVCSFDASAGEKDNENNQESSQVACGELRSKAFNIDIEDMNYMNMRKGDLEGQNINIEETNGDADTWRWLVRVFDPDEKTELNVDSDSEFSANEDGRIAAKDGKDSFEGDINGVFAGSWNLLYSDCSSVNKPASITCFNADCGNGAVQTGEACDDGNNEDNDGCDKTCDAEAPVCGNGVCEFAEDSTTCPSDCGPAGFCGDGTCDAGLGENPGTCPADCTPTA